MVDWGIPGPMFRMSSRPAIPPDRIEPAEPDCRGRFRPPTLPPRRCRPLPPRRKSGVFFTDALHGHQHRQPVRRQSDTEAMATGEHRRKDKGRSCVTGWKRQPAAPVGPAPAGSELQGGDDEGGSGDTAQHLLGPGSQAVRFPPSGQSPQNSPRRGRFSGRTVVLGEIERSTGDATPGQLPFQPVVDAGCQPAHGYSGKDQMQPWRCKQSSGVGFETVERDGIHDCAERDRSGEVAD